MRLDGTNLYVTNVQASIAFYTNKVGLELEYTQDDAYASFLFSNGVRLGIKKASNAREIPGSQTIIIAVDDIHSEYTKAKQQGHTFYTQLSDDPWGLWFSVLDPDKNLIEYLQRA